MEGIPKKMTAREKKRLIEENEARARVLISDIVPMLREIPEEGISDVEDRIDAALKEARRNMDGTK